MFKNVLNLTRTTLSNSVRHMHDRKLPSVIYKDNINISKKNNYKNLTNKYKTIENDEIQEKQNLKNFGISIRPDLIEKYF